MHFMVILIIDDINRTPDVLDAWEHAGVGGITIIESTGVGRLHAKQAYYRDDVPLMPSLRALLQTREEHHRTIFSIVEGEGEVTRLIDATQSVLGQLTEPNTGILFAMPISHVVGVVHRDYNKLSEDDLGQ